MVQPRSLRSLLQRFEETRPACLLGTLHKDDPDGLGRIVRDEAGNFAAIVEQKDASAAELAITEVNMSTYVFNAEDLRAALLLLSNRNRQQEYYLTDCPGILLGQGKRVSAEPVLQSCEALSVNTVSELRQVEQAMRELGYPAAP
jgi:bifunctional UDP-N-acetylglucosamine pyrophosphorylase/glucosamine-1-phosphate N-acetyltransferase/UDP-N-acetylglucosamine pyrophosphorylase